MNRSKGGVMPLLTPDVGRGWSSMRPCKRELFSEHSSSTCYFVRGPVLNYFDGGALMAAAGIDMGSWSLRSNVLPAGAGVRRGILRRTPLHAKEDAGYFV